MMYHVAMPTWNAEQYLRFAEERTQPCRDLLHRVLLDKPRRLIDLGCGPGNSTQALAQRWPDAAITGLDSSTDMLAAARRDYPQMEFIVGDIAAWKTDRPYDLVFSNAALQWLPEHAALLDRLLRQVAPGGALAVQLPANDQAPAQRLIRRMAASPEWKDRFNGNIRDWHVHELPFYYDALCAHAARIDLWTAEYQHVLPDPEAIVQWYKGTGLRPFLDALTLPADRERFLADYLRGIAGAYPRRPDGRLLFPFRRLFIIAYKPM